MVDHCTRCKKDGHRTRGCQTPWPHHTEQECDRCLLSNHETGAKVCKGQEMLMKCKTCGHENDHNTQACKINNSSNPEHLNQWTKTKYETAMKAKEKTAASLALRQVGSSQSSSSLPDLSNRQETSTMKSTTYTPEPLTAKQRQKLKWASQRFPKLKMDTSVTRSTDVVSNFVKLNFSETSNVKINKYRIVLGTINKKPVIKREVRRALIEKLLHIQRPPDANTVWVSDYHSYVMSVGSLYREFDGSVGCAYAAPHLRTARPGETCPTLDTVFWHENQFNRDDMTRYFYEIPQGNLPNNYHPESDLRSLNIVMWKHINRDFAGGRAGKKFYPEGNRFLPLGNISSPTFRLHEGYFTSVRPGNRGLLLNINPATTAFFPETNLQSWIKLRWPNGQGRIPYEDQHELKDIRVRFRGDGVAKPRIIYGFSDVTADRQTFVLEGPPKQTLTVYEYTKRKYGKLPLQKDAFCVNVGNSIEKRWYAAEHLEILPWQVVRGQLPPVYAGEMVKLAKRTPEQNKAAIGKSFEHLKLDKIGKAASYHEHYGFHVENNLVTLKARRLQAPILQFDRGVINLNGNQNDPRKHNRRATWDLKNKKFFQITKNPRDNTIRLGIIRFESERPLKQPIDLNAFQNNLTRALMTYGYRTVASSSVEVLPRAPTSVNPQTWTDYMDKITVAHERLKEVCKDQGPMITIFILDSKDASVYALLKCWSDLYVGVPAIGVTEEAALKQGKGGSGGDENTLANICLKINFKLGGINHILSNAGRKWFGAKQNTMIVGADVTHPGNGPNKTIPSMAGVVATNGPESTTYLASARLQDNNTEFIAGLQGMIEERLLAFQQNTGKLPDHILFYRDGVSESQFGMVTLEELPLIEAGCHAAGARLGSRTWFPGITLLVVGKRHHTRFYPKKPGQQKMENFQAGLVVDTEVVSPDENDFYLQSHDSALGTARSAHYIVLYNSSDYSMTEIQELTNKICFTGSRATKALSVCTPARYADILCDRLRCYMKNVFKTKDHYDNFSLDQYRTDLDSWNMSEQVRNGRLNPWSASLDDIMFYL